MLEVKHLCKDYDGFQAVKDISFAVQKGEVLVLLGTSGCGKTTTLKMINGLIERSSGDIFIDGDNTDSLNPYTLRKNIGYVIQETGLFPHYNVAENIGIVPTLNKWPQPRIAQRIEELLLLVGLDSALRTSMPHELSGGQRQRVGLARALAADPSLILLDEPFGALDPITRKDMQGEFKALEGALDKAMVMVTHDVVEAVKLGDQICLMDGGEVQQIGTPKELVFHPKNDFVKTFFQAKLLELEPNVITLKDLASALAPVTETVATGVDHSLTLVEVLDKYGDQTISFTIEDKAYETGDVIGTYYKYRKAIIDSINGRV